MVSITEKAMLARLNVSKWTARKHDKAISQEVATQHGTGTDAGRYNKVLIDPVALQAIGKAESAAREFHYTNTLPWMDDGARILPAANFFAYCEAMAKFRADFDREVSRFLAGYADAVEAARARLNGLFDEKDYPPVRDIARKFDFDIVHLPLPDAADFRVSLNAGEESRIRAEIEARTSAAIDGAVRDTWNRVHDVVARMAERLRAYSVTDGKVESPFRDSLVSNVRDLVDLLPRLNITGDAALAAMAERLGASLAAHDPQTLRDEPETRATVARAAESILADMAGYFGGDAALAA